MNHFAVQKKLTQHCISSILWQQQQNYFKKKKGQESQKKKRGLWNLTIIVFIQIEEGATSISSFPSGKD